MKGSAPVNKTVCNGGAARKKTTVLKIESSDTEDCCKSIIRASDATSTMSR